jgi:hypothetical protein
MTIQLNNVSVPITVRLIESASFIENKPPKVLIEVPKLCLLMDTDTYAAISQDPTAMAAFVRSRMTEALSEQAASTGTWPSLIDLTNELASTDE